MQLFRHTIPYNPAMLGPDFYFWNRTTNTIQLHYGMISSTLFELVAIIGLHPIGEIIPFDRHPEYVKEYSFKDSEPAYSTLIRNNMGAPSTSIFDDEHVAFFSCWLNDVVFYSQSPNAIGLLPTCCSSSWRLAKLIIAQLYEEIGFNIKKLKNNESIN